MSAAVVAVILLASSTPVVTLAFPTRPYQALRVHSRGGHSCLQTNNDNRRSAQLLRRCNSPPLRLHHNVDKLPKPHNLPFVLFTTETTEEEVTSAVTEDSIGPLDGPSSVIYYDEVLDNSNSEGVVCSRGVCVIVYDDDDVEDAVDGSSSATSPTSSLIDSILSSYLGPRVLLAFASLLYGTNFALGSIMQDQMAPSAATSDRMFLAGLALSPFLFKLNPKIAPLALASGVCVSIGYITQSLALIDTSPATVAFLGAATVIVCPFLEATVNKKPMGFKDAPQTWLAATLCILGVGVLEFYDPSSGSIVALDDIGSGDILALGQSVGFGTSFVLTEGMMRKDPSQALPITAVQVTSVAFYSMLWSIQDGWIGTDYGASLGVPFLFGEPELRIAAAAVVWTGLVTTALNRLIETTALGRVSSNEASVILATEPLWAALFAAILLHDDFGANDYIGGTLIVLACLATSLKASDFRKLLSSGEDGEKMKEVDEFM